MEHHGGRRVTCKPSSGRRLKCASEELTGERYGSLYGSVTLDSCAGIDSSVTADASLSAPAGWGCESRASFSLDATERILFSLAQAVEQRDHQTAGHCERLAFISVAMGMAMGLNRGQLLTLYRGGYLHDLGKVGISDSILFKPGKLTASEWVIMQSHTTRGEEICRPLPSLQPVLPMIRHHHERWDGGGYPDGLSGSQIPLSARIVQIADIYDALVSERPYKRGLSQDEALRTLREETAKGWRDPDLVAIFFRLHDKVIAQIAEYAGNADRSLEALRLALAGLEQIV